MIKEVHDSSWYHHHFLYETGALRNKLHITDPKKLQEREYMGSAVRALTFLRKKETITSIEDLKTIHKIMFGWLYEWAGVIRDYQLLKEETQFLEPSRIPFGMSEIDTKLAQLRKKDKLTAQDYAFLLDRLNYLHPFREGNGRSSKVFLQALAANHQQVIEYPRTNEELIAAQKNADIAKIASLLKIEDAAEEK
ncbi:cell filamentation protein Fic [Lactobacillus sp. PV037]|uniref:Fic/DOC family protein n=1 Tax=unclassified Lactobacillus TaxID=2620435 RepID=UPI0022400AB3|nr:MULTISPECIES: Fic family protein [unclassified Lactobacillus]QNQ82070.1 cell filamentation protein Fic [Lactobacillus sp. PV012]QNQ83895.1 cell filamentation protein Fic [Lactobacillus sp. PV037]